MATFENNLKIQTFKKELSYIKNESIKSIAEDLLCDVPNYFFEVSSSSTGKYHPDYAVGTGGLVRHTQAACLFANILSVPNPLQLSQFELDCAMAALILHDSRKLGITDEAKVDYTRFDHPILAANAIQNKYNFDSYFLSVDDDAKEIQLICDIIANAIRSHMGQWNTSKYAPGITLELPTSKIQQFVHMCDYLASRKEIDIKNLF